MRRNAWSFVGAAAACALTLAACSERADVNPNAPGSPGTGNSVDVVRPAAPDSPPGGPSGIAGSVPHPGASGGAEVMRGTTGSMGTTDPGGRSQAAQPGVGTDGGLGGNAGAVMGASPDGSEGRSSVPAGSSNTTSGSNFGNR
jgi:hypothetical protein